MWFQYILQKSDFIWFVIVHVNIAEEVFFFAIKNSRVWAYFGSYKDAEQKVVKDNQPFWRKMP